MKLSELPEEYNKMLIGIKTPVNRAQRRKATFEGLRIVKHLATVTDAFYKHLSDPAAFEIYDYIFKSYMATWKQICINVAKHEKPNYYMPKLDYFYETFKTVPNVNN